MVSKEKKTKGFYSTVAEPSSILSDLVPHSKYKMFMVVANNGFEGPPSNTVEFTTKEGGEDAAKISQERLTSPKCCEPTVTYSSESCEILTNTLFIMWNHRLYQKVSMTHTDHTYSRFVKGHFESSMRVYCLEPSLFCYYQKIQT